MEKRLREAQLFKEEGNQHYWEGNCRSRLSSSSAAGLDPSLPSPIPNLGPEGPALMPEQENILQTTQTDWYNNLVACLLQMEPVNYEQVREYSQKDYDQARHHLLAAVNRQPKDANLTQSELSSYYRKEKQLYLGMFG
uniref:Uncharacterized protein n=1 Tax=Cricetulus griseus TaxID=10029 RepID=A0A8C2M106_CRIGR